MTRASQVSALAAIVERIGAVSHPAAGQMRSDVSRLYAAAVDLDRIRSTRDLTHTEAAHALRVAKQARKYDTETTAIINRAGDAFRAGSEALQRRIAEKANLKPPADAQEIRTAFRSLSKTQRAEQLAELIEQGRGPEMAAILGGSLMTSGLTLQERDRYEQAFLAKHAGAELEEQQALQEDLDALLAATRAAGSFVKDLTNPGKLAAIERASDEANAALEAFNQTLAGE